MRRAVTIFDFDLRALVGPKTMPSCSSGDSGEVPLPEREGVSESESEALVRIRSRRPRVLVVDDEDLFREALVFELSEEYASRVDSAADADEALGKAELGFDLVLMDISMPGMDGFEALREMRARALAMQVVLMTADKTAGREAKARELGVLLLEKPIEPKVMERVLLSCLGGGGQS